MARPILVVIIVTTLVSVVCSSAGVVGDSPWAKDSDYVQRRRIQRSPTATADITRGVCVSLCNCTVENVIFLNVQCDFAQNKVSSHIPVYIGNMCCFFFFYFPSSFLLTRLLLILHSIRRWNRIVTQYGTGNSSSICHGAN